MRQCPYCGEHIDSSTSKCPFCGSNVEPRNDIQEVELINSGNIPSQSQKNSLSNGLKVLFAMISTIPLVGQLFGIILAIIYMNAEGDADKKSYGKALLTGTLIITLVTCLCCVAYFVFSLYFISNNMPELFEQFKQIQ
ncbi:MAG: hypothetical protein PWR27_276 [Petroclostridium sp.]|uniref:zinc ribbon domain-containing protein n=1 Tax=Petroclostridium xylanilyticum TaxID=1792311 RepID=UPI000B98802C|nr:zinc ribbon domain-containing protein [Petroclostridium xylanilyticum]MBZ4644852.1 hypothetical protein [Clostridia bacterium]MDK2809567.1 hypothetical protein [Petroclostridium sp.]